MKIYTAVLIAISGVVGMSGCNSSAENAEAVDYAALEELPVEMVVEIGESESYLPGRLQDLFVASDGTMLVSDWASVTIEQFDANGNHVATVAREGGGPGEVSSFFSLLDSGNDTLIVWEEFKEKTFFAPNRDGIYEEIRSWNPKSQSDRMRTLSLRGIHSDTTYFATLGQTYINVQMAQKNNTDYLKNAMAIVNHNLELVEDSVQMLDNPVSHVSEVDGGYMMHTIPYRGKDELVVLDDGRYLIARPDSSAFFLYSADHEQMERINFSVRERPVSPEDRNRSVEHIASIMRGEVRNRIYSHKPPYLDVWVLEDHILLHTDNTEEGKQMAMVDFNGKPSGTFILPEYDEVEHVEDNRIYTIHSNPDLGNMIRIYEVAVSAE